MSQILERYRLIAMISPLLLLAACSHAPHSADPPRLDVPAHFSNEEGGEGILDKSSRRTLPVDWWTAYGDPHLNALVRAALERNTELTIARARVDEASAATRRARASAASTGLPAPLVVRGHAGNSRTRLFRERCNRQ